MSRHLLYVVGVPGAGKSTLIAALTEGLAAHEVKAPFAHRVYPGPPPVAELGARRDAFSGTDALSMSVQPKAEEWLHGTNVSHVLAEGDRLANGKFFTAAIAAGWELRIAYLAVSRELAAYRRQARAAELGVQLQSDAWLKGRLSKVERLCMEWGSRMYRIEADGSPARVLDALRATGDTVVAALDSHRA